jgi:GNAT superfamily N-acetyltransferase
MAALMPLAAVTAATTMAYAAKTNVVHLTPAHFSLTREAAHEFFEESQLPGKLDYDHWIERWNELYNAGVGTIMAYIGANQEVRGIMGALCTRCMMTGDMEGCELFWYVRQPYRGTPAGIRLLMEFERWAKERQAVRVKMIHLMSINAETLMELYKRFGYTPLERAYIKNFTP